MLAWVRSGGGVQQQERNHCKGSGECAAGCLNDYPMWVVVSFQRDQGIAQLSDEIAADAVSPAMSIPASNRKGGRGGCNWTCGVGGGF